MTVEEKQICELQAEIGRLKSELNNTNNYIIEIVSKLEDKFEELMHGNQPKLIRKQLSQSARKAHLQATLEIVRAASHELAQPLTVLIGRCELLYILADKNPEIKRHINSILSSAEKIDKIVRKIQSINKQMAEQYAENSTVTDFKQSSDSRDTGI